MPPKKSYCQRQREKSEEEKERRLYVLQKSNKQALFFNGLYQEGGTK
jgi:hypothetical protein